MATSTYSAPMYSFDGETEEWRDGTLLKGAVYIIAFRNGTLAVGIATDSRSVSAFYASFDEVLFRTVKHRTDWTNVVGPNSGLILAFRITHPGRHTVASLAAIHAGLPVPIARDPGQRPHIPLNYALYIFLQALVDRKAPEVVGWDIFIAEFRAEHKKAKERVGGGEQVYHLVTSKYAWLAERTVDPQWPQGGQA